MLSSPYVSIDKSITVAVDFARGYLAPKLQAANEARFNSGLTIQQYASSFHVRHADCGSYQELRLTIDESSTSGVSIPVAATANFGSLEKSARYKFAEDSQWSAARLVENGYNYAVMDCPFRDPFSPGSHLTLHYQDYWRGPMHDESLFLYFAEPAIFASPPLLLRGTITFDERPSVIRFWDFNASSGECGPSSIVPSKQFVQKDASALSPAQYCFELEKPNRDQWLLVTYERSSEAFNSPRLALRQLQSKALAGAERLSETPDNLLTLVSHAIDASSEQMHLPLDVEVLQERLVAPIVSALASSPAFLEVRDVLRKIEAALNDIQTQEEALGLLEPQQKLVKTFKEQLPPSVAGNAVYGLLAVLVGLAKY